MNDFLYDDLLELAEAMTRKDTERVEIIKEAIMIKIIAEFIRQGNSSMAQLYEQYHEEFPEIELITYNPLNETFTQYMTDIDSIMADYNARLEEDIERLREHFSEEIEDERLLEESIVGALLWQIRRLTATDIGAILAMATVASAIQLSERYGLEARKVWVAVGDERTCAMCNALNGTDIPINETFLMNGQVVETTEGNFTYDFINRYVPIAHPHDRCRIEVYLLKGGG